VDSLPVTAEARHAQWAGEEFMFSQFPVQQIPPIENHFAWREPDFALTNKHPGGVLAFYPNLRARSLCVLYGAVVPRCAADLAVAVSVFATIDQPELAALVGRRIRTGGSLQAEIRILRRESRGGAKTP